MKKVAMRSVSMTEAKLWENLRPQLMKVCLPLRIENIANVSLPDAVLIYRNYTIWVELKIVKSGLIWMPKYQFALGVELCREIDPDLFWIIMWDKGEIRMVRYIEITPYVVPKGDDLVTFRVDEFWHKSEPVLEVICRTRPRVTVIVGKES
jgi:hypothetical protein